MDTKRREKPVDQIVKEMKSLGNWLIPYNFPQSPIETEDDISTLKIRETYVDGYSVFLHYCKAQYEDCYLLTFQVFGKYAPFLPFCLVCKLAKKFLGEHELSLVEIFREGRKLYCWTVILDFDNNPIPTPHRVPTKQCNYEGLHYSQMKSDMVHFF